MRIEVAGSSRLELFPLRAKKEADQYIVGRPEIRSYVAMSDAGYAVVEMLGANRTIAEVKEALTTRFGGEAVQLRPFLEALVAAGFVKSIDARAVPEGPRHQRYHLTGWKRRHVAWLFSAPALVVCSGLVAAALGIVMLEPRYVPRPADFFVAPTYLATVMLATVVSVLMVAKHELAHLAAAKFVGIEARFGLSHRMYFPVVQTELTDLWLADKGRRYLVYVAGMASDVVAACAVVVLMWLHDRGAFALPDLAYRTCKLAVVIAAAGVLWQFNVFLRTDVYYVFANFFDCKNLASDAQAYLKSRLRKLLGGGGVVAPQGVSGREFRAIRIYSVLYVLGTVTLVAMGTGYLLGVIFLVLSDWTSGVLASQWGVFRRSDKIAFVASVAVTCGWLAYSVIAKRRRRSRVDRAVVSVADV